VDTYSGSDGKDGRPDLWRSTGNVGILFYFDFQTGGESPLFHFEDNMISGICNNAAKSSRFNPHIAEGAGESIAAGSATMPDAAAFTAPRTSGSELTRPLLAGSGRAQ
jgi:hypothetical protein